MAFKLESASFANGKFIPIKYTGEGEDVSPPLKWSGVPEGIKSFALISDDPDAPMGTWVHWVLYDIPAETGSLSEGIKKDNVLDDASKQGRTSFMSVGYGGPYPPPGAPHRYFFKLYALDKKLNLPPGITKEVLLKAMEGHILAKAQLMGKFKR